MQQETVIQIFKLAGNNWLFKPAAAIAAIAAKEKKKNFCWRERKLKNSKNLI